MKNIQTHTHVGAGQSAPEGMPKQGLSRQLGAPLKLLFAVLLTLLCGQTAAQECKMRGTHIINLSQDEADKVVLPICTRIDYSDTEIRNCIKVELSRALPNGCKDAVDIFVPGTNGEFGAWSQFNSMFNTENGRGHITMAYQDAREADNKLLDIDPAAYDQGVIDARKSLILLLDGILGGADAGFGADTQIRVFGHSKGSHAVALVSEFSRFRNIEFYAFGQPGRTERDISSSTSIGPAKRGRPGYIEKLRSNLVGITWRNDEVRYAFGKDLTFGSQVPEIWGFPGYIRDTGPDGTSPLLAEAVRLDHHNTYGGFYTNGRGGNEWREGEGNRSDDWPYCATGDKVAWDSSECDEGNVTFVPWFWGSPECRTEAALMMKLGDVNDRYYIGYSGPRDPRSCRESERRVVADYRLRYMFTIPDKDCTHRVIVRIQDLDGRETDSFSFSGDTENENEWIIKRGDVVVPLHVKLVLDVDLIEQPGGGTCNAFGSIESEVFIDYMELDFTEPGTGSGTTRTIIGHNEGFGGGDLTTYGNTAWEQPNKSREGFEMRYGRSALKIQADAEAPQSGNFNKRVHLVD